MKHVDLHKFIVSATNNETDALNTLSVWYGHPGMRAVLEESDVFDTPEAAHERAAHLIRSASEEGMCEPGHECGRCVDWDPRVFEIHAEIVLHEG